jgi:hypothetical protein
MSTVFFWALDGKRSTLAKHSCSEATRGAVRSLSPQSTCFPAYVHDVPQHAARARRDAAAGAVVGDGHLGRYVGCLSPHAALASAAYKSSPLPLSLCAESPTTPVVAFRSSGVDESREGTRVQTPTPRSKFLTRDVCRGTQTITRRTRRGLSSPLREALPSGSVLAAWYSCRSTTRAATP